VELWCVGAMAVCVILMAASAGGTGSGSGHYADPGWMAVVAIPSIVIGLLVAASPLRGRSRRYRASAGICFGIGTGLLYGVAALAIKALSGILVGNHGAASIAVGLVSSPYLYVLVSCSAAAMLCYQVGLQSCRASILIPVSNVTGSVYFIIAGTWLFHEHLPTGPAKLALHLAAIAVAGLVLVTLSRQVTDQASGEAGPAPVPGYAADPRRQLWPWRTRCSTSSCAPSTSAGCCTLPTTRCCTTRGCAGCTGSRTASR
jgi:hypothetical protein